LEKPRFKVGDRVRVKRDAVGEHIQPSYYHFTAILISRKFSMDREDDRAFKARMKGRKKDHIFWESELRYTNPSTVASNQLGQHRPWIDASGVKRCPECGKKIEEGRKKYCSVKCRVTVGNSRHDANRANNEERRTHKMLNSRKWREKRREEGRCTRCGGELIEGYSTCWKCRDEINLVRTRGVDKRLRKGN